MSILRQLEAVDSELVVLLSLLVSISGLLICKGNSRLRKALRDTLDEFFVLLTSPLHYLFCYKV